MRRDRLLIGLSIALILGILASVFIYHQIARLVAIKPAPASQLVVSAERLPLGTKLEPSQLRVIAWPGGTVIPGMFTRVEDVVGRSLLSPLVENEPVLESKLAPRGAGPNISAALPDGMRAITIPVTEVVGVAGFVVPGSAVDVLVTASTPDNRGSVTRTVLEDVKVLAVGQQVQADKEGRATAVYDVVTLEVSPEDADKVAMANSVGQNRIQLALRNTIDVKKTDPPLLFEAGLFGFVPPAPPQRTSKPRAPTAPAAPVIVEVIYGNKRETKAFPNP
ncbi:MAG: Flp pilus assembly protein CpaB [Candidatus Acidiferrales bacterium]